MLLEGRFALITGGSRGIGFQIAKIFLEEGATVLAVSRSETKLAGAVAELPSLLTFQADTASPDDIDRAVAWVSERWGKLDILVNNAGMSTGDTPLTQPGEEASFTDTFHTNLFGPYFVTKRFLPLLQAADAPRIINIGSVSGVLSSRLRSAYGVSKLALHGLTIATASELADKVAINVLSPGWVVSDMAPDAPNDPRMSAEAALALATQDWSITGRFFRATPDADSPTERTWAD